MLAMDIFITLITLTMALLLLNVNGLRDIDKLNSVFSAIKSRHANITFLQETFWDDNFNERYKHLWEGKIFYNNCVHIKIRGEWLY